MNKTSRLILAATCTFLACGALLPIIAFGAGKTSAAPAAMAEGTGKLVIVRSANLGLTVIGVSIDGEQKAKINYNGRFEAPLSVGPHVITTVPIPNREHAQPAQTRVNVEKGKTYTFTAARSDVSIVLK